MVARKSRKIPVGRSSMPFEFRVFALAGAVAATLAVVIGSPAAQNVQDRTIRWGHLNNTDHPVSKGVQKFTEIVAAKSGGKIKVKEYPANQLGSAMQQQTAVRGRTP